MRTVCKVRPPLSFLCDAPRSSAPRPGQPASRAPQQFLTAHVLPLSPPHVCCSWAARCLTSPRPRSARASRQTRSMRLCTTRRSSATRTPLR